MHAADIQSGYRNHNRLPIGSGGLFPRCVLHAPFFSTTAWPRFLSWCDRHSLFRRAVSNGLGVLLVFLVLGYGGVALFYYYSQDGLVYEPEREMLLTPQNRGLAYDDVWLKTEDDVRVHGWLVPAKKSHQTILYFHGNDGNISQRIDLFKYYHTLGLSVFMIDYRGYGTSEGAPSEIGTYRDAEAAWRYLTQNRGIAPKDIVIYGRSLGGGIAAHLASQHRAGALILESTFTSITDVGQWLYPWLPVRQLSHFRYPVKKYLSAIDVPVLIVHSREDDLIPFNEGKQLLLAAHEPRRFLEIRGTHDDGFLADVPKYTRALELFLRESVS